jgi:hypothetical protein
MTRGGQQDAGRLCARIIEIGIGPALSAEQPVEIVGDEVFTANGRGRSSLKTAGWSSETGQRLAVANPISAASKVARAHTRRPCNPWRKSVQA